MRHRSVATVFGVFILAGTGAASAASQVASISNLVPHLESIIYQLKLIYTFEDFQIASTLPGCPCLFQKPQTS